MSNNQISCDIQDRVATLTLNNPPLNVVTLTLSRELGEALDTVAANDPYAQSF
jgi:enoyl-CoA hydratase